MLHLSTHCCHFTFADSVNFPASHTSQLVINITGDTRMISISCGTSKSPPSALPAAGKLSNCSSFPSGSTCTGKYRNHLQSRVRKVQYSRAFHEYFSTSQIDLLSFHGLIALRSIWVRALQTNQLRTTEIDLWCLSMDRAHWDRSEIDTWKTGDWVHHSQLETRSKLSIHRCRVIFNYNNDVTTNLFGRSQESISK